jgi:hypothetical protein
MLYVCLKSLSKIYQLYCGGQFIMVKETRLPGEKHLPASIIGVHCHSQQCWLYCDYIKTYWWVKCDNDLTS